MGLSIGRGLPIHSAVRQSTQRFVNPFSGSLAHSWPKPLDRPIREFIPRFVGCVGSLTYVR
eukprot:12551326-Heterocapsa_arctica.AAC.1